MAAYRSVRGKGDTKTRKSRRVLKLPTRAVYALRAHRTRQAAERLAAGEMWREHDLVFCREDGTPLDLQECPNGVAVSRGESAYVGSPSWLPWLPRARASLVLCVSVSGSGQVRYSPGDRLVDRYLEFGPQHRRAIGCLRDVEPENWRHQPMPLLHRSPLVARRLGLDPHAVAHRSTGTITPHS